MPTTYKLGQQNIRLSLNGSFVGVKNREIYNELIPGDGFSVDWGNDVSPVGTPGDAGYNGTAIAHWNVAPNQTLSTGRLQVGVVAFHMNEIDRVEFYLNGGPATNVTEMMFNEQNGTWEYWATIRPETMLSAGLADGVYEVRAIVYPQTAGQPRILDYLPIVSNANGSLTSRTLYCSSTGSDTTGDGTEQNPFRQPFKALKQAETLDGSADGATVVLQTGDYFWGPNGVDQSISTTNRWCSIVAAEGASPRFTERDDRGFRTELLYIRGVEFAATQSMSGGNAGNRKLWLESCNLVGPGYAINQKPIGTGTFGGGVWTTNCTLSDWRDGFVSVSLARGCSVDMIGSDAYTGADMVVNCTATNLDPSMGTSGFHADLYQLVGDQSNRILYGLYADDSLSQGIFIANGTSVTDIAIVNVLFAKHWGDTSGLASQLASPIEHLVVSGLSLPNSALEFRASLSDALIRGSHFSELTVSAIGGGVPEPSPDPAWFVDCHCDNTPPASLDSAEITTGDPLLVDPANGDFSADVLSPLRGRLSSRFVPVDIANQQRPVPDTVGAYR